MEFSDRESLMQANASLINQLQNRLKAKRFRPQEGDSVKLAYMRVLVQALQAQDSILKNFEVDEVMKELDGLKEALKCQ